MNIHKNARLSLARRIELVQDISVRGLSVNQAAALHGVTAPTARKWLGRFLSAGHDGLRDASSRPASSPRSIAPAKALAIVELRHKRLTQARIATALGVSKSTVGRVLARAGLSRLADLQPAEPVVRYEHDAPGDLLHIDTKRLGRIERPSHRRTGNRKDSVDGAGWEMLFVAVDDHARIAFTDMHPDEKWPQAVQFLHNAVAYFASLGVKVQRLLTDNGSAFRSKQFAQACRELGIRHKFTRAYRTGHASPVSWRTACVRRLPHLHVPGCGLLPPHGRSDRNAGLRHRPAPWPHRPRRQEHGSFRSVGPVFCRRPGHSWMAVRRRRLARWTQWHPWPTASRDLCMSAERRHTGAAHFNSQPPGP